MFKLMDLTPIGCPSHLAHSTMLYSNTNKSRRTSQLKRHACVCWVNETAHSNMICNSGGQLVQPTTPLTDCIILLTGHVHVQTSSTPSDLEINYCHYRRRPRIVVSTTSPSWKRVWHLWIALKTVYIFVIWKKKITLNYIINDDVTIMQNKSDL